jgi:hypothetical protein
LWPRRARPDAKLALEVVLPTPPLPDVTTIIFATNKLLYMKNGVDNCAVENGSLPTLDD